MTVVWLRPPKRGADRRQARRRVLAGEIHRDLARPGDAGGAARARAARRGEAELRRTTASWICDDGRRLLTASRARGSPRVEAVEDLGGEVAVERPRR